MNISISNRSHMADFSTTKGNVNISGSYKFSPETNKLTELNFSGNVSDNGYFNGNISSEGNVNLYGVKLSDSEAVCAALNELYEGIVATITASAVED